MLEQCSGKLGHEVVCLFSVYFGGIDVELFVVFKVCLIAPINFVTISQKSYKACFTFVGSPAESSDNGAYPCV